MKLNDIKNRCLLLLSAASLSVFSIACDGDQIEGNDKTSVESVRSQDDDLFEGLEEIDPAQFEAERGSSLETKYSFDYNTGGDIDGMCLFDGESFSCSGTPASDIPDLDIPPYTGRPSMVTVRDQEYQYTVFEGIPPSATQLETGQKVTLGDVTCGAVDGETLRCQLRNGREWSGVEITGDNRDIEEIGVAVEKRSKSTVASPAQSSESTEIESKAVDVADYRVGATDSYAFILEDEKTVCWMSTGPSNSRESVVCSLNLSDPHADDSVKGYATELILDKSGARLSGPVKGLEPFPYKVLQEGNRLSVGDLQCTAGSGSDVTCSAGSNSVEVRDRQNPSVPVVESLTNRTTIRDASSEKNEPEESVVGEVGDVCGKVRTGREGNRSQQDVIVKEGEVDCEEAITVMQKYIDLPHDEYYGRAQMREVDTWNCATPMPRYGTSHEYDLICEKSGSAIGVKN
ncbi:MULTISPECIES: hypothetical protein [unclassified Corynebacterium]|uniref:hypothetical protein n=1 Tax=unclassified Corynebacterium TaxID=2624378 RepID=UPI0030AD10F9